MAQVSTDGYWVIERDDDNVVGTKFVEDRGDVDKEIARVLKRNRPSNPPAMTTANVIVIEATRYTSE